MSSLVSSHLFASSGPSQTVPAATVWQLVERRAHELYEQRFREHGHAKEDWFQAESEIVYGLPPSDSPEPVRHSPATAPPMPSHEEF
jgi:hypothetical protein